MPEDWELLETKVQGLHESDLELSWWTKHLLPLIRQFARASAGDVNHDHWKNLCKLTQLYGVDDLNGWILKFIPYVSTGFNSPPSKRNPVLELTTYPDPPPQDRRWSAVLGPKITGCTSNILPTGVCRAPVKVQNKRNGQTSEREFIAGFMGVTQSAENLSLRPLVGWAICEASRISQLIETLRLEHQVEPSARRDPAERARQFGDGFGNGVPADLWQFYTETNGATFSVAESSLRCRIFPLGQIGPAGGGPQPVHPPTYRALGSFAELSEGTLYVVGVDPETWRSRESDGSRWKVFHWTGKQSSVGLTLVAHSFTQWLEQMLCRRRESVL